MATGISSAPLSSRHLLASAVGLAVAAQGGFSYAADAAPDDNTGVIQLGATSIEGQAPSQSVYNPVAPSSPKYTEALRDTPQTITVVPKEVIHDQNLLTLRDVLSTVPGITFGAGEGGSGYGDSINLRGFSASGDIYVDGVRDSAQYSRTDPFNLEQVEVVSGASSVYSGSGAVGGTINLVSKQPELRDKTTISAGIGTDNYKRTTLDTNQTLNDTTAFRLNLMVHGNDVPGRDYEDYERWGIAPSIAFGLGTPTRVTVSYEHQKDNNTPQYGIPIYNGKPMPGVGWSDYYGYHNINDQQITSDSFSLKLEHDFNDAVSVRNFTRVERVRQDLRASGPEGALTGCLASGTQITGAPCAAGLQPGYFQPSGGSLGNERNTQNKMFTNQTDVTSHFSTGFIDHTLVTGISISREEYEADTGKWLTNANGSTIVPPPVSYSDPNSDWAGPVNFTRAAHIDGALNNRAVYAFDTLKLNPQWEINGGLRYEHNAGSSVTNAYSSTGVETPGIRYGQADDLTSYRMALVYKPVENGSFYIAYGNSKTPSQASVNGGCYTPAKTSSVATNNCDVSPETAVSYEIGTKWDLLDNALSLTGAIFRNDRTNYKVADNDPSNLSGTQTLDGKARADGVALGLSGQITDRWKVFANYTYLNTRVLRSASDYTLATTGIDVQKGEPLTFTPKHAASIWTVYDLPYNFQVGYGITAQTKQYLVSAAGSPTSPGYAVQRAMLGYKVNKQLNLQLNINNLFDKEYLTRIRNNGWAVPGDGRAAVVSADYTF